ncbi:Serine/threonine protein kinase [Granulicella sibirica]|uniref:Serine/threonine protein kinase n=2 Tax=Granulicella sibirica TaxID=2479048 RepID=A0A4Q0T1Z8_9BACT|nr:Serine/threonine protein kinase [Granulicella sibirica]
MGQTTPAPDPPSATDQGATRDLKAIQQKGAQAAVTIPRSYAVVIGIATYKNLPASAQLEFPNRDAEDIYAALISPEGGQFPAENVHKLINDRATVANIRHEIEEWLPSVTKENDRVLIYFAGHGFVSSGKGYLAPYDVDIHNVANSAYPMDSLGAVIGGKIKGKWKVLITDACHSGAITPEADRKQVNQTLLDVQKSLFSLTASRDREQSFESEKWGGGHGIFTYYVVKGLEGEADTNGDGVVDADELGEYVHTNVRLATDARQNPTSERGSFDPNMVLAYNATRVKANLPPPQYGNLIVEANMDNTEVWIDGRSAGIVNKDKPLRLPGITPGAHTIKGIHLGYEPDGPREEQVYPGQDTTVTIRMLIARRASRAAVDEFDKGIEFYNKGFEENYKKAADHFERAIQIDPKYSQAYLYLGRVENALFEDQKALTALKKAIEIDPDYMEARSGYAAALLDAGDLDESIRQLNVVTRREPDRGTAWYLLSQAYARKGDFPDGKTSALTAIKLTPKNAEAHFWLAECLRQLKEPTEAMQEYNSYLLLSNFDTGKAGQLNYYVAGYLLGMGRKKRAAQTDIWKELRGQANLGLCDSEYMEKQLDPAIRDCNVALTYLPNDLFTNYRLGVLYSEKFNQQQSLGLLAAAKTHFDAAIAANPDANEADRARKYVKNIDGVLAQVK